MRSCFFSLALIPVSLFFACAESPIAEEREEGVDPVFSADGGELPAIDAASADAMDATMAMPLPSDASSDDVSSAPDAAVGADAAAPIGDAAVETLDAGIADADLAEPNAPRDAMAPMEAAAPMCTMPARACGDRCIDTRSDLMHCGQCGRRCGAGESCIESRCWPAPPEGCASRTFEGRAYLFCRTQRSWRAARQSCLGARMDLAIIGDAEENEFVRGFGGVCWIGANDLNDEGTFRWPTPGSADRTNGAAVMSGYRNWLPNEPNNTRRCQGVTIRDNCLGDERDEDCAELNAEGRWNDADCTQSRGYVCEAY